MINEKEILVKKLNKEILESRRAGKTKENELNELIKKVVKIKKTNEKYIKEIEKNDIQKTDIKSELIKLTDKIDRLTE